MQSLLQEQAIIRMQLVAGQIHGHSADIVHPVDVNLAYLAHALVVWNEAFVGLLDVLEKAEV